MTDIKRIDIKEFVENGYLQEVNRRFFHILGLALEVEVDDDDNYSLSGVWDYRDDPEGIVFDEVDTVKVYNIQKEIEVKVENRQKMFGWFLQPYENPLTEEEKEKVTKGE